MAVGASLTYEALVSERAHCPAHPDAALTPNLRGTPDRYFGLGGSYDYAACSLCGAWVLDPKPSASSLEAARGTQYPAELLARIRDRAERGRPIGISGRMRARGTLRQLRRLGARFTADQVLLDVGSELGFFARAMRDLAGLRVRGLDSNPETQRFAESVSNVEVDLGELEAQRHPDACFDLISAWHVLERSSDPVAMLAEMFRIAKPGAWIVVETTTLGTIAEIFRSTWIQLRPPVHLRHLRPSTLLALVHAAGFEVLAVRRPWLPGELAGSLLLRLGLRDFARAMRPPNPRLGWVGVFALTMLVDLPVTFFFTLTRSTGLVRVYAQRPARAPETRAALSDV